MNVEKTSSTIPFGVNLIGIFGKRLSLSESARLILESLKQAKIPISLISANNFANHLIDEPFSYPIENIFKYSINLFTLDSPLIFTFIQSKSWKPFKDRYNIGLIFWETTRASRNYTRSWTLLNEIWTTSRFMQDILSKLVSVPVYHLSQPIEDIAKFTVNSKNPIQFSELKSAYIEQSLTHPKQPFTFLFSFNFGSVFNRKNPEAIINAFQIAFPNKKNVRLIIKSTGSNFFVKKLQMMQKKVKGDPRLVWIDQSLNQNEYFELVSCCNCYVSLHRSEGLGLTLAEAMLLNKPVIATGYSGNMDFMNDENSYLCSYSLIPIGKGSDPYPANGIWAEPNIQHAAELMRYVEENREEAFLKACKGRDFIKTYHSFKRVGELISQRLSSIQLPIPSNPEPKLFMSLKYFRELRKFLRPVKRAWKHFKSRL